WWRCCWSSPRSISVSTRGGPSSGPVTARVSSGRRRRLGPEAFRSGVARRGRRPSPGALLLGYARMLIARWTRLRGAIAQFLYGLTGYEFARHALEMRHELESVFMVVTFGDLIGVPVLPPYYSLRLLPYVTRQIAGWKRRMLRERDVTDVLG